MLVIRCKECGKEVVGHSTQARSCGCPNMATITGDKITAIDLGSVIMVRSKKMDDMGSNVLSSQDLAYQEKRRKRKVRKLDFEIR